MNELQQIAFKLHDLYGTALTEQLIAAVDTERSVGDAMVELRELLPQFKSRVITFYDADEPGMPYVSIVLYIDEDCDPARSFIRATMADCIAEVREWAASAK